jgi:deoxyxylulose-5-phosphate synthase
VGLPDQFLPHGSQPELLSEYGLTAEGVAGAALLALEEGETGARADLVG